ncbi:MAG: outer membrane beta-barrel protein [Bacteroidales bacterium]|nr:outer membrane beta-barrel protein [Bacteroidales bacterium]
MRRILLVLVSLFAAVAMSAQNHNVTVKLEDASTGDAVGFATVSLTPAKGNPKYALTDNEGKGTIEKVKDGTYTFKAEIMGYKTYSKEVEIKGATDLGTIKMELDQQVLDAASVSATGNPIIIKKDTVEYNASSFKTTDTDMLINLLKKLPGIEVDDSGTITANGETITKITIDGKTFFLDDPQMASQNLPAKMIEKVKVVKKKSEQAEFTGIDDGNDETIIDLTVQKSMMNGIFGNVTGGVGHDIPSKENDMNDWRYTGNGMVGRFTNDTQLSVIANGNNGAGGMGFTNMGGNMMGQMMGGGRGMGGGAMGGGMGGFGGGITTSWMGGVNAAADLLDGNMELSGNYMYNGSITESLNDTYQENYYDGFTQIQKSESTSNQRNNGHRVGVRLDHKFSDNTSILFQPQFNYSQGGYNQTQIFDTWNNAMTDANKINDGYSSNYGLNSNWQANGFLLFRQRLGMPGRTLSVNLSWTLSNNHSDGYNQSVTQTYAGDAPTLVNQRIDQGSRTQNAGARLVYTEPLGGGFYVEGSYQYNYSQSNTDKDVYNSAYNSLGTYDYDIAARTMEYIASGETRDDDYSNKILNRNINQSAGLAFMYQEGDVRAQLGITANPQNQHNETNGKVYDNKVLNWAPRAMLFYDFNDNANIRINYNGRSGQPSTNQLMPVLDNSNPMSMSLGNPYLTPYFNHNGRIELEYSNRQTFFTARLNLQGGLNQNPIVNASWVDVKGRTYTFPVNGIDTYNGSARIMVNAPIAKSNFSISNNANINYSKSGSYVGSEQLDMSRYWNDAMTDFNYDLFHDDYPDLNDEKAPFISNITQTLSVMERLNLNYRSDYFEVRLNGGTRFNKPWYSVKTTGNNENVTWNNSVGGSINWTIGYTGLTFTTDANYNWYNGYKTEQPSRLIWNAGLQMPIIYNQATIALNAYDILGQRKNLSTTQNANTYSESRSLSIGRYIIVSFTWRFGTFGGRNGRMGMGGMMGGGRGGRGGGRGMGGGMMGGGMMGGGMPPMM